MAAANGITIELGARFEGAELARFADKRTFILCDIEGDEIELLDPARYPSLLTCFIIVECHKHDAQSEDDVANLITNRFHWSHKVTRLDQQIAAADLPAWCKDFEHLDLMLIAWEWRHTPTPWLVMIPKQHDAGRD